VLWSLSSRRPATTLSLGGGLIGRLTAPAKAVA
jgi:hypothetical protein